MVSHPVSMYIVSEFNGIVGYPASVGDLLAGKEKSTHQNWEQNHILLLHYFYLFS